MGQHSGLGLVLFPQSKKVVGLNPLTSLCLGGFSLFFLIDFVFQVVCSFPSANLELSVQCI